MYYVIIFHYIRVYIIMYIGFGTRSSSRSGGCVLATGTRLACLSGLFVVKVSDASAEQSGDLLTMALGIRGLHKWLGFP